MNPPEITNGGEGEKASFLVKTQYTAELIGFLRQHGCLSGLSIDFGGIDGDGGEEDVFTVPENFEREGLERCLIEFFEPKSA
jgi:hypothetical protein